MKKALIEIRRDGVTALMTVEIRSLRQSDLSYDAHCAEQVMDCLAQLRRVFAKKHGCTFNRATKLVTLKGIYREEDFCEASNPAEALELI